MSFVLIARSCVAEDAWAVVHHNVLTLNHRHREEISNFFFHVAAKCHQVVQEIPEIVAAAPVQQQQQPRSLRFVDRACHVV
jgi:hypothetical protein